MKITVASSHSTVIYKDVCISNTPTSFNDVSNDFKLKPFNILHDFIISRLFLIGLFKSNSFENYEKDVG